ncbi:hypothetical protein [Lignipirellula cremea]|uniref:Uncharacterized protein n=1 Tax=Lignipirellula cremea TaxID=2528010 RepID=A0A518E2Y5_9BACT|nr:hypothetical protein [Lignipirellula cremea]QDU98460.1 hypothetical protein Pla8534_63280 [Lignipirellula cremea]
MRFSANEKQLTKGTDFLAPAGRMLRLLSAVLLTPFAAYFLLVGAMSPLAALMFGLIQGPWELAMYLFLGGLAHFLVGAALGWFVVRLYSGQTAANGITLLPDWMIWVLLIAVLPLFSMGVAAMMTTVALRCAAAGEFRMTALLLAGAVGFCVAMVRTIATFWQATHRQRSTAPAAADELASRQSPAQPD